MLANLRLFDGTTDNSRELLKNVQDVVCAESVDPRHIADAPAWIREISPRWEENMDVRKRTNTFLASRMALDDGIEWLINIDADELLLLHSDATDAPAGPGDFLASIPGNVDQILVPNVEALPIGAGTGRPFVDCTLFFRRFPLTEGIWRYSAAILRQVIRSPKIHAWYDYYFYKMRFLGALPRLMRHPITREAIPAGYFLGYSNHKSFIRNSVASEFSFNIHKWQKVKRRPRSIKRGMLLHYDLCNAEYFRRKFRQRQPTLLVKSFFCRHMFAHIARDLPTDTATRFFLNHICISRADVLDRLRRRGILREICCVSQVMNSIQRVRQREI